MQEPSGRVSPAVIGDTNLPNHLRDKYEALLTVRPEWKGWARPLSAEQIAEWEQEFKVKLPAEFVVLLTEVGDRAPVSGHSALIPLAEAIPQLQRLGLAGPVREPFPFTGDASVALPWDDEADEYADPHALRGCIPLLEDGCGMVYLLVVTGPERGRVWRFVPGGEQELHPLGHDLFRWYESLLDAELAADDRQRQEVASLEAMLLENPRDDETALALASLVETEAPERAIGVLRGVLTRHPDAPYARERLARLLFARGEYQELIDWTGGSPRIDVFRGASQELCGDHEAAVATLTRALSGPLSPLELGFAHHYLARAYLQVGDPARARDEARGASVDADTYAIIAAASVQLGRNEEAIKAAEEALRWMDPSQARSPSELRARSPHPAVLTHEELIELKERCQRALDGSGDRDCP